MVGTELVVVDDDDEGLEEARGCVIIVLLVGRGVLLGVVQVLPVVGLVLIVELVVGADGVRVGVLAVLLAVGTGVGTTEGNKPDVGFEDGTLVVGFPVLVVVEVEEGSKEGARDGQPDGRVEGRAALALVGLSDGDAESSSSCIIVPSSVVVVVGDMEGIVVVPVSVSVSVPISSVSSFSAGLLVGANVGSNPGKIPFKTNVPKQSTPWTLATVLVQSKSKQP